MNPAQGAQSEQRARRRLTRICCEEPFRIFFPAGLFLGVVGVSLWPLFYSGLSSVYPGSAHARLMIEGLMASFIFGFLATAGPRITSAPHFSAREVATILTLDLLAAGFHAGEAHRLGDICFALCLLFFAWALACRFQKRQDSPPPNFVLVALALVSGIVGTVLLACFENAQYARAYQFGNALLNEGLVLLQILGVAPFFLVRLLDLPLPDLPESRALPPGWLRQAAFAALIGLVIIGSFLLEVFDWSKLGGWIRIAAIVFYLAARMPFRGRSFLADCLRIAIASVLLGFVAVALLPPRHIGALHIVFIAGFNFVAFTVAIRVVFGHSGKLPLLEKPLPFFIIAAVLLFLAMISRFTADFAPNARVIHLLAAAICWLCAALFWALKVIPKTVITEPEASTSN